MELALSFAELDLPPESLRRLDLRFAAFETIASGLSSPRRLRLDHAGPPDARSIRAELDRAFASLQWVESGEPALGGSDERRRIWRPPLEAFAPADRVWLERFELIDADGGPPVPTRRTLEGDWYDPDRRDLDRFCEVLEAVNAALTADPSLVA